MTSMLNFFPAVMAEWLRRLTRNQMGSSRVGSNPTHSDITFLTSHMCMVTPRILGVFDFFKKNVRYKEWLFFAFCMHAQQIIRSPNISIECFQWKLVFGALKIRLSALLIK